jgi:hypothetical protein
VSKRRYAIKVGPKPPPQIAEISRIAVRDQKLRVATLYDLNPDCSVIGIPTVRILEPSKNGAVTFEKGTGFPTYPANNSRAKCNDNSVDSEIIFYMPQAGYMGADSVTVEILYPEGNSVTRRYAIEVK